VPDAHWATSVGLTQDGFVRLMRALGYRLRLVDGTATFSWNGQRSERSRADAVPVLPVSSPFAMLAEHPARRLAR
jgi:ATP-dependent RNA helicase SUPV3L1/SUV3